MHSEVKEFLKHHENRGDLTTTPSIIDRRMYWIVNATSGGYLNQYDEESSEMACYLGLRCNLFLYTMSPEDFDKLLKDLLEREFNETDEDSFLKSVENIISKYRKE